MKKAKFRDLNVGDYWTSRIHDTIWRLKDKRGMICEQIFDYGGTFRNGSLSSVCKQWDADVLILGKDTIEAFGFLEDWIEENL